MEKTTKEVLHKPLIKDFCTPFGLDPDNKELVSFDSKGYSKAAAKYIEQLETENKELIYVLKNLHEATCEIEGNSKLSNRYVDEIIKANEKAITAINNAKNNI
jgi:hypothetical protein